VHVFCLSAMVHSQKSYASFKILVVYGPTTYALKDIFEHRW
jgi:hypothetical protein